MLSIKKLLASSLLAIGILTISGCSKEPKYYTIGKETIEVKNDKSFIEGKFLRLIATLQNKSSSDINGMVYQIEWYDDRGVIIEQSSWKPFTIIKNQQIQISELSSRTEAVDYRIVISTPK